MAREYTYLVYRRGSNAANQSMTPKMAVAIVTSASRKKAEVMANEFVNCYNNQHLELVAYSSFDASTKGDYISLLESPVQRKFCDEGSIMISDG